MKKTKNIPHCGISSKIYEKKYHTVGTVPKSIEKYHTVGTVPKSNWKMVEKGKMDNLNTHIAIHDSSLSWYGTGI